MITAAARPDLGMALRPQSTRTASVSAAAVRDSASARRSPSARPGAAAERGCRCRAAQWSRLSGGLPVRLRSGRLAGSSVRRGERGRGGSRWAGRGPSRQRFRPFRPPLLAAAARLCPGRQLRQPEPDGLHHGRPVRVLALIVQQLADLVGGQGADVLDYGGDREVVIVRERQAAVIRYGHYASPNNVIRAVYLVSRGRFAYPALLRPNSWSVRCAPIEQGCAAPSPDSRRIAPL